MDKLNNWLSDRTAAIHHRQILVITGKQDDVRQKAMQLLEAIDHVHGDANILCCGNLNISNQTDNRRYSEYLGQEFHYLFYDAFAGFRLNALAALAGTIASNGLLVLLCPDLKDWPLQSNSDFLNRVSYGFENDVSTSHFLTAFCKQLQAEGNVLSWHKDKIKGSHCLVASKDIEIANGKPTEQQQTVINAVIKVAEGHRKRPLVLRADRGRGKSAALGFAVKVLVEQGKKIAITAPNRKAVEQIFKYAVTHTDCLNRVTFHAIDELVLNDIDTDILIVDEAAAIPSRLLQGLIAKYHRVVFSSTTYGYEGTGRGFDIRFLPFLERERPEYKQAILTQPIRWYSQDVLEQFLWDACHLLPKSMSGDLSAFPRNSSDVAIQKSESIQFLEVQKEELVTNKELLNSVFTLLVDAHYQTTPDDLMALMDAPEQSLFIATHDNRLVGVVLANQEGGISEPVLSTEIVRGNRRVKGHLLAQQAAMQSANIQLLAHKYLRIVRIAVSQDIRRTGIGSRLLKEVWQWAKANHIDYLGTSFGASADIIDFWLANGFSPILFGFQKDKSSGEHSVLMIKQHEDGCAVMQKVFNNAEKIFKFHLSGLLNQIPTDLVAKLLQHWSNNKPLTDEELKGLFDFADHNRSPEMTMPTIARLLFLSSSFSKLTPYQEKVLIRLSLQQWPYREVVKECQFDGKKALLLEVKNIVKQLIA